MVTSTRHRGLQGVLRGESGQALVLVLGLAAALMLGTLVLAGFGQALGAKGRHQRAADLAAVSAAKGMQGDYPRLFEAAVFEDGSPNPRHLSQAAYLARARAVAARVGRRNGVPVRERDVSFDDGFAPTRVTVWVRGETRVRLRGGRRSGSSTRIEVTARATAALGVHDTDGAGKPAYASGGGYSGPLAYRMGKPMRPDVAVAFDRIAAAARRDGLALSVTSGFRSDAEQARLFAANPNPKWVAPPGTSLHRYGTELDLGPPAAYGWLAANARRFGFIQRYRWEDWHYGCRLAPYPSLPRWTNRTEMGRLGLITPAGRSPSGDRPGGAASPAVAPSRDPTFSTQRPASPRS